MLFLNLSAEILNQPELAGLDAAAFGVWTRVVFYCVQQENGGRVAGARKWPERAFLAAFNVSATEMDCAAAGGAAVRWDGDDLVVACYPHETVDALDVSRATGAKGGRASGAARRAKAAAAAAAAERAAAAATRTPVEGGLKAPSGTLERKEKESKEKESKEKVPPLPQGGEDDVVSGPFRNEAVPVGSEFLEKKERGAEASEAAEAMCRIWGRQSVQVKPAALNTLLGLVKAGAVSADDLARVQGLYDIVKRDTEGLEMRLPQSVETLIERWQETADRARQDLRTAHLRAAKISEKKEKAADSSAPEGWHEQLGRLYPNAATAVANTEAGWAWLRREYPDYAGEVREALAG